MPFAFYVAYYIFGLILSVPYCLLAGWSWENYPIVALVLPGFLFVWLMIGTLAGHVYLYNSKHWPIGFSWRGVYEERLLPGAKGAFWSWTALGLLPIVVYWTAVALHAMGYESIAGLLKVHRYMSPLYVIYFGLCLLLMWGIAMSAWEGIRSGLPRLSRLIHR